MFYGCMFLIYSSFRARRFLSRLQPEYLPLILVAVSLYANVVDVLSAAVGRVALNFSPLWFVVVLIMLWLSFLHYLKVPLVLMLN